MIILPDNIDLSKLNLVNVHGESQKTEYKVTDGQIELTDISQIPNGVYFIQVLDKNDEIVAHSRLVKQ